MTKSLSESIRQFEIKQMIAAALALIIAIGISMIVNTLELNSVAHQATKFISRLVQLEEFREIGLTLDDTRLSGFTKIDFRSSRPGRNFSLPATFAPNTLWHNLVTTQITLPADNQLEADYNDTITFEYNRFRLAPYALLIWLMLVIGTIPQTRIMKQKLIEQFEKDTQAEHAAIKADIARQVRHNLRTPLAALMRIPAALPDHVKTERELLESSVSQIRAIISALDESENPKALENESSEIYDTLTQALREIAVSVPKKIQFGYEVDDSIVSALIPHTPHELRALLGNIVNNSIDAISSTGRISIAAQDTGPEIQIYIEDTGRGIDQKNRPHIFDKGFSSGKPNGSGIGLYHAKTNVELWGGRISVSSEPGKSTRIQISLPIAKRASWYVSRLKFSKNDRLIILDDQLSAHSLWRMRLEEVNALDQAEFAHSDSEIESLLHVPTPRTGHTHYLFDYDIQSNVSGLDILTRLPNDGYRYLVTGHFDEPKIRDRCDKAGVYLLPKGELARIQIIIT